MRTGHVTEDETRNLVVADEVLHALHPEEQKPTVHPNGLKCEEGHPTVSLFFYIQPVDRTSCCSDLCRSPNIKPTSDNVTWWS